MSLSHIQLHPDSFGAAKGCRESRRHNSTLWNRSIGVACCAVLERSHLQASTTEFDKLWAKEEFR
ncbi:hypothetical protein NDI49_18695 [Trichocoleus sp. ST-U3]